MGTTSRTTVDLRIVGHRLPGLRWSRYQAIHVGVQRRPGEVVGLVPGDAAAAVFDLPLQLGPLAEPEPAGRLDTGSRVEASLDLTDTDGGPRYAPVRPPIVRWQVVPAEEGGAD